MPFVTDDRIGEVTTVTGTGAAALGGAFAGHKPFSQAKRDDGTPIQNGDVVPYVIEAVNANREPTGAWESGLGTYNSTTGITRTTVLRSSNSDAAVTFLTGDKLIYLGIIAPRVLTRDDIGAVKLLAATAEPPTPAAGSVYVYSREIAPGYSVLKNKRPSGVDSPLQDSIMFNTLKRFQGNGTAMIAFGAAPLTASAAGTAVTPSSGSAKNQNERIQYATTTTAGALHTLISPSDGNAFAFRGAVAGEGGFRWNQRVSLNLLNTGTRWFCGVAGSRTAATNVDPLTVAAPARIGLAINANTGNMQLVRSDGTTAAAIDLGANFPVDTTSLYELLLVVRPHDGSSAGNYGYRVRRYTTNSDNPAFETSNTLTTNLPAATTLLHPWAFITNNAQAAAVNWHFCNATLEKDW